MGDNSAETTAQASNLAELARINFLDRYQGATRALYEFDLRIFYEWCDSIGLSPLRARRPQLEAFGRWLMTERKNSPRSAARRLQTVRTYYKLAVADEIIDRDPTLMMQLPKWHKDPAEIRWLDRYQMGQLLRVAQETSPAHHALIALMCMLGLRASEACSVRIEDYADEVEGHRVLRIVGKGGKPAIIPVPIYLLRILDVAKGDRTEGPLVLTRKGEQQTRNGAYWWVRTLGKKIGQDITPHALRHSAITAVVDSGADLWEAQDFARHADVRHTEHYYRRRVSLDRHGAHLTARAFSAFA